MALIPCKRHHLAPVLAFLLILSWETMPPAEAQSCDDPPPRLEVGGEGRVLPGDANNVREAANTSGAMVGQIPGGGRFRVLAGPVCSGGYNWWQVAAGDLSGWTVEGTAGEYWVEPISSVQAHPIELAIAPKDDVLFLNETLTPGERARVNRGVHLRETASTSGTLIGTLDNDDVVAVLGPPVDAEGFRWWRISHERYGLTGWAVEGVMETDETINQQVFFRTLAPLCPMQAVTNAVAMWAVDESITVNTDGYFTGRNTNVFVLDVDTGEICNVTGRSTQQTRMNIWGDMIQWSPDGMRVLYPYILRRTYSDLIGTIDSVDLAGSEPRTLTNLTDNELHRTSVWSPDGTQIAYVRDLVPGSAEVWVRDVNGERRFAVTNTSIDKSSLRWQGETITYLTHRRDVDSPPPATRLWTLEAIAPDGANPRTLVQGKGGGVEYALSPDGSTVIVAAVDAETNETNAELWRVDVATGNLDQITHLPNDRHAGTPAFSDDGSRIAYLEAQGITTILQVIDATTLEAVMQVDVSDFGDRVAWAPDNSAVLVYRGFDTTRTRIARVDIASGSVSSLFDSDSYFVISLDWMMR